MDVANINHNFFNRWGTKKAANEILSSINFLLKAAKNFSIICHWKYIKRNENNKIVVNDKFYVLYYLAEQLVDLV